MSSGDHVVRPAGPLPARQGMARLLREFAAATGERCFLDAARALEGKRPGRRPVDDQAALEYAKALLDAGVVKSPYAACSRAALLYCSSRQVETDTERLRKKFRVKYCSQ